MREVKALGASIFRRGDFEIGDLDMGDFPPSLGRFNFRVEVGGGGF